MRHYKKGRKLGTDASHTKAMKKSLVTSLFLNDRIKTTETRAKEIRGDVDKVITWAKRGDLHSRRLAITALGGDKLLAGEIFSKVEQGMFADRNSGFTRIFKLGPRKGDNAPIVIMELCMEPVEQKAKPAAKKTRAKKVEKAADKPAEEEVTAEEVVAKGAAGEDAAVEASDSEDVTAEEVVEKASGGENVTGDAPSLEEEASAEEPAAEEASAKDAEAEAEEAPAEEAEEEKQA